MSQVTDLAIRAFKHIGMFTEDRNLPAFRLQEAVDYLNLLMNWFGNSEYFNPLSTSYDITLTTGKRTYTIGDGVSYDINYRKPISINYINLTDGTAVYNVMQFPSDDFYKNYRSDDSQRRPEKYFLEEQDAYSILNFFEKPDQDYSCTLTGKFVLATVDENDDLGEIPPRYLLFLEYALARQLADIYPSQPWTAKKESMYKELFNDIKNKNKVVLTSEYYGGAKANPRSDYSYDIKARC